VLTRAEILNLLPHGAEMVLLDAVESMTEESIVCLTGCHRASGNPLRRGRSLPAVAAVELAAQALALHGALCGGALRAGVLVLVRDLRLNRPDLDVPEAELRVEAGPVRRSETGCMANFRVGPPDEPYVSGRIGLQFGVPHVAR
jgi:predicted hotdog family 3-hydroxylacyl-ACP dehydratase